MGNFKTALLGSLSPAVTAAVHSGKKSLEESVIEASKALKKNVSVAPRERDSDDIATATLNEVKQLRIQLQQQEERQKERDMMFVEALEKMQRKIDVLEDQQKQLLAPVPEEPKLDARELSSPQVKSESDDVKEKKDTRGLWARIWNR